MPAAASQTIAEYLNALESGSAGAVLALFAPGAVVHSPLYGQQPATEFYPALFADSSSSRIEPLNAFQSLPPALAGAAYFRYHWTLANGQLVVFDCVDIFQFNDQGLITDLRIIYDASETRRALSELKS